jgi:hypothetical protein
MRTGVGVLARGGDFEEPNEVLALAQSERNSLLVAAHQWARAGAGRSRDDYYASCKEWAPTAAKHGDRKCLFRVVLFMLEQKKECSATDALEEAQEHFREAADFGQPEAQSCMGTLLFRKTFGGVTTGGRSLRCEKRSTLWLLFALRWRSTFNSRMPQRGVSSLNWRCLGNGLSNAEREKKVSPVVEGAVAVCDKTCAQAKDAIFLLDWHSGSSGRGARGTALWLLKREP